MNLISCADKCKFQKDGYCTLNDTSKNEFSSNLNNNCMYFAPKEEKISKKTQNNSIL